MYGYTSCLFCDPVWNSNCRSRALIFIYLFFRTTGRISLASLKVSMRWFSFVKAFRYLGVRDCTTLLIVPSNLKKWHFARMCCIPCEFLKWHNIYVQFALEFGVPVSAGYSVFEIEIWCMMAIWLHCSLI